MSPYVAIVLVPIVVIGTLEGLDRLVSKATGHRMIYWYRKAWGVDP